jgi:hypothetical protein
MTQLQPVFSGELHGGIALKRDFALEVVFEFSSADRTIERHRQYDCLTKTLITVCSCIHDVPDTKTCCVLHPCTLPLYCHSNCQASCVLLWSGSGCLRLLSKNLMHQFAASEFLFLCVWSSGADNCATAAAAVSSSKHARRTRQFRHERRPRLPSRQLCD